MKKTQEWEKEWHKLLFDYYNNGILQSSAFERDSIIFIQHQLDLAYKQGVEDEIKCVETSGEHLDLQQKLHEVMKGEND